MVRVSSSRQAYEDLQYEFVLRADYWDDNSDLIADMTRLGYLRHSWRTLDPTYGYGTFWKRFKPLELIACDADIAKSPFGAAVDVRAMPFGDGSFKVVVLDLPYKLNGNPTDYPEFTCERYGAHDYKAWQERIQLILDGMVECVRVLEPGGYLHVKCMDQVCSGEMRWQTDDVTNKAKELKLRKVDRFDFLSHPREQPAGTRQVHARSNYSTMLVFQK